jgi:hypothetical protein
MNSAAVGDEDAVAARGAGANCVGVGPVSEPSVRCFREEFLALGKVRLRKSVTGISSKSEHFP